MIASYVQAWRVAWLVAGYVVLYVGVAAYYVNCSPVLVGATGRGPAPYRGA